MKKIFIYLVLVFVLNSFASADLTDHLISYWSFDTNATDSIGNNNLDEVIDVKHIDVGGMNNGYYNLSLDNDLGLTTGIKYWDMSQDWTLRMWIKINTSDNNGATIFAGYVDGAIGSMYDNINSNKICMWLDNDGTPWDTGNSCPTNMPTIDLGKWYYIVYRRNLSTTAITYSIWINGTGYTVVANAENPNQPTGIRFGTWGNGGYDFFGDMDEIALWNRSLTELEIISDYNGGAGSFYPFVGTGSPATPTIENPTPLNDYTSTINVTLNVSHSTINNDVRYYLYIGNTTTLTETNLYLNNITRNASEWKSFYTNLTIGTYYYKWKVQNVTNGLMSGNTTQRTLNIAEFYVVKFYFYDEKSNGLISGETFSVYLEKTGFSHTYTTSTNPYSLVDISTGLYNLKTSSTNYLEKQYFDLNLNELISTDFNVYLINTTDSSEISFHIMDSSSEDIENVDVGFYRVISGVTTNIAEEQSDYGGKCKLYLDTNYEYIINFSKSGYAIKTINLEPTLADSPYSIYLDDAVITVPPFVESYLIRRINYTMTYTNATKTVFFEWNDNNDYSDSMCLDVIDLNTTYFSNCSTATSSSFTYAITGFNQTYIAKSTAKKNERTYVIDIININLMEAYIKFGIDSLIIDWIVFLTLAFIGLFHPIASVIMGSIGLIGMYLIGLLPVGFSSIMGIIFVSIIIIIGIMKDERG